MGRVAGRAPVQDFWCLQNYKRLVTSAGRAAATTPIVLLSHDQSIFHYAHTAEVPHAHIHYVFICCAVCLFEREFCYGSLKLYKLSSHSNYMVAIHSVLLNPTVHGHPTKQHIQCMK